MKFFYSIVAAVILVGLLSANLEEQVNVNVGPWKYSEVPLWLVILTSVASGATVVGLMALIEGATMRLANRRLRREVHKLETESSFLRTQPSAGPRGSEPDALRPSDVEADDDEQGQPPSAPVYRAEKDDRPPLLK